MKWNDTAHGENKILPVVAGDWIFFSFIRMLPSLLYKFFRLVWKLLVLSCYLIFLFTICLFFFSFLFFSYWRPTVCSRAALVVVLFLDADCSSDKTCVLSTPGAETPSQHFRTSDLWTACLEWRTLTMFDCLPSPTLTLSLLIHCQSAPFFGEQIRQHCSTVTSPFA